MKDWAKWHEEYENPASPLSRRLEVVTRRLRSALERAGLAPIVLSLCSGDGRDVIAALTDFPGRVERAVLVENDPGLAERARQAAGGRGLTQVEVRCRDAGAVDSFRDVLPVDVLLLCGIFGNVEHQAVRTIVGFVPHLVREGGYVIWTRGGSQPDRRPEIRRWFSEAGMEELAFDGEPEPYGVGLNRVRGSDRPPGPLPERLFSFG